MRPDIVPGAVLPDYELSDHTAKRRKLSDLQGQHPMVLVLSRGGFCPKDRRQAEGLRATPSRAGGLLLPAGHHQHRQHHRDQRISYRHRRALAVSFLMPGAWCKKIWTSPNTPILRTIP